MRQQAPDGPDAAGLPVAGHGVGNEPEGVGARRPVQAHVETVAQAVAGQGLVPGRRGLAFVGAVQAGDAHQLAAAQVMQARNAFVAVHVVLVVIARQVPAVLTSGVVPGEEGPGVVIGHVFADDQGVGGGAARLVDQPGGRGPQRVVEGGVLQRGQQALEGVAGDSWRAFSTDANGWSRAASARQRTWASRLRTVPYLGDTGPGKSPAAAGDALARRAATRRGASAGGRAAVQPEPAGGGLATGGLALPGDGRVRGVVAAPGDDVPAARTPGQGLPNCRWLCYSFRLWPREAMRQNVLLVPEMAFGVSALVWHCPVSYRNCNKYSDTYRKYARLAFPREGMRGLLEPSPEFCGFLTISGHLAD